MSNKITIKDLGGLSDYATSLTTFADQYETAIANSRRGFHNKNEGAEGDAITAFFIKLEELHSRVFDRYPEALRSYAKVVTTYHDAVTSAGFSGEVKSLYDDAVTVATTLNGTQLTAITDITESLKAAFDKATTAMGTEAETVDEIDKTAGESLSDAADARKATATTLETAYSSFVSDLQSEIENLKALKTSLDNASYVFNISPSTISAGIKSGNLSADEMYVLDEIDNEDESLLVQIVLTGDSKKIGEVDPEKVDDNIYYYMSTVMSKWVENEDLSLLDKFYTSLGSVEDTKTSIFFEKLTVSSQIYAVTIEGLLENEYAMTGVMDSDRMKALLSTQKSINNFIAINRGLYIVNYGQNKLEVRPGTMSEEIPINHTIAFHFDDSTGALQFKIKDIWGGTDEYSSEFATDLRTLSLEESQVRLMEIDEKRKDAIKNLIKDSIFTVTTAGATVVAPEVIPILATIQAFSSGNVGGAVGKFNDLSPEAKSNYNRGFTTIANLAQSGLNYLQKVQSLDEEEREEILKIKNTMLDKGGWVFKTPYNTYISDELYYDFETRQSEIELDKNGVTGYLQQRAIEDGKTYEDYLYDYQKTLTGTKNLTFDSEVVDYLLGRELTLEEVAQGKQKLTLSDMTREQLKQVQDGVKILGILEQDTDNKGKADEKFYEYLKNAEKFVRNGE